jgi:ABC-2 type transport system permease protein
MKPVETTSRAATSEVTGAASHPIPTLTRPIVVGRINIIGVITLYRREVQRFMTVALQTLAAPVITSVLFLVVFSLAIGNRGNLAGGVDFAIFLVPGLIMMNVLQNAFANTSSSLVISKVQGNIIDILMPPLGPGELLFGLAMAGITRGFCVGIVTAVTLISLGEHGSPVYPLIALAYLLLGSLALSFAGILAGIWANKFDEMAAITNFIVQPLTFLSGTFYSINRLPAPFDMIAGLNPIFYAIDGFRYGMLGLADRSLLTGFLCLCAVNVGLGVLCYQALSSGYRLKS